MIGVLRVYGNYWSSKLREYIESNKLPAELVDGDWVILEYGKEDEDILGKFARNDVLKFHPYKPYRHKPKFTEFPEKDLQKVKDEDIKYWKNVFEQQYHGTKKHSSDFIRAYVFLLNLVSGNKKFAKKQTDFDLFRTW